MRTHIHRHTVHIINQRRRSSVRVEIAKFRIICHRFAVAEVIIADYQNTALRHKLRKTVIAVDILAHAMCDLQDRPLLPVRDPGNHMQFVDSVLGADITLFFLYHVQAPPFFIN